MVNSFLSVILGFIITVFLIDDCFSIVSPPNNEVGLLSTESLDSSSTEVSSLGGDSSLDAISSLGGISLEVS